MEENTVFRLTKSLENTDGITKELSKLQYALKQMVEQDYLQKIHSAAQEEKAVTIEHPPREVTLLRALSAFTDEAGKQRLDQICQSLLLLQTMTKIQNGVQHTLAQTQLLEARSSDAPAHCAFLPTAQIAGVLMSLSLLSDYFSKE